MYTLYNVHTLWYILYIVYCIRDYYVTYTIYTAQYTVSFPILLLSLSQITRTTKKNRYAPAEIKNAVNVILAFPICSLLPLFCSLLPLFHRRNSSKSYSKKRTCIKHLKHWHYYYYNKWSYLKFRSIILIKMHNLVKGQ